MLAQGAPDHPSVVTCTEWIMSYTSSVPEQSDISEARWQNTLTAVVFFCALVAIEIRLNVSSHVMNVFVNYTGEGGAFYEKLHSGTLALLLLVPFAVISRPFVLRGSEIGLFKALLLFSVLMFATIFYLGVMGRAGSAGFIIDTYMAASAAGLVMLTLPANLRRTIGDVTIMLCILSAVMGFVEAMTQHHILPYNRPLGDFRPIGLTMHPLALGATCATAIGFAALPQWRLWVRLLAILVLLVGCAVSTARTALMLSVVEIVLLLVFTRWPRLSPRTERRAKLVTLVFFAVFGLIFFGALAASGFLNRFGGTIFDESFMARITIYRVFGFFNWSDLMLGVHVDELMAVVKKKLNLDYIESAPVVLSMLFGIPIALMFTATLIWIFGRLLRDTPLPARIAVTVSIIAALSNNTLTSKTPAIAIIFVLLIAYRHTPIAGFPVESAGRQRDREQLS